MAMNPDVKAKLVQALRSGAYQQTTGKLHDDAGFCCLGVLCDLHAKETGNTWRQWHDPIGRHGPESGYDYLNQKHMLPPEVKEWAGLPSRRGAKLRHVVPRTSVSLEIEKESSMAALNDNYQLPFSVLADLIEEQL